MVRSYPSDWEAVVFIPAASLEMRLRREPVHIASPGKLFSPP
jgi:hypothetical protein